MRNAISNQIPFLKSKPGEKRQEQASCHGGPRMNTEGLPLVTIVGSPNVGKSVLFNVLTGAYVTVSNYPGTTVEVARGKARFGAQETGVMDTPGMYSLLPITEEERVARGILLTESPTVVIHVIDAKNVERMLPMTLQLIEAGLPVILVMNLMDEADRLGVKVDLEALQARLQIPIYGTALTLGRGAKEVREAVTTALRAHSCCPPLDRLPMLQYPAQIQNAVGEIEPKLQGSYGISKRAVALLLLQNDLEVHALVKTLEGNRAEDILEIVRRTQAQFTQPISYLLTRHRLEAAQRILEPVLNLPNQRDGGMAARLSEAMIHPITGLPILLVALYLLYQFVGVFGAQTLVGFLEANVFGKFLNPWVDGALARLIPWPVLRDLFGGQFGVITLGLRYAIAIILPIVGTFFLAFSVIEDSGYLPRLAMLIDRVFKKIGLNGRAVIPIVLGFGCDTMATIVTRTLETRRERLLSTFLLSLAIPCSAQLGVMLALLNGRLDLLAMWVLIVTGIFLLIGFLTAKLMPGERPTFYMELPPLRLPQFRNVLVKTYTRMEWYLREVLPLFVVASLLIWLGRLTGLFDLAVSALQPVVTWIGLPKETAMAFLFGFFRRDYGAAGLYDMRETMNAAQLLVAVTTMTIFIPCVAQFAVTVKEQGWKTTLAMAAFIFPFAILVGGLLNLVLKVLGWFA